jgi:hypothetical protein
MAGQQLFNVDDRQRADRVIHRNAIRD